MFIVECCIRVPIFMVDVEVADENVVLAGHEAVDDGSDDLRAAGEYTWSHPSCTPAISSVECSDARVHVFHEPELGKGSVAAGVKPAERFVGAWMFSVQIIPDSHNDFVITFRCDGGIVHQNG